MYEPQRLHPAAILEFLIGNLYKLFKSLLPFIIVVFGQTDLRKGFLIVLPLILLLYIFYIIIYWLRYVYYIQDEELHLEYGIFVKKKRYINFGRVQTVQISSGIIQRLFGLVKLQVETAGGGDKAELILPAVSKKRAEELRDILESKRSLKAQKFQETETEEEEEEEPAKIFRLSTRDLLLLASTSNSIGVILAGFFAIFSQLDEIFPGLNIWEIIKTYINELAGKTITVILLIVLAIFLLAWTLSLLENFLKFGGFELRREENNIKINQGITEKKQLTIPIKKIQAIRVVENVLRKPFGMVSIQVVSLSNVGAKGEASVLFPIIPQNKVQEFLELVLPEFAIPLETNPLPLRARPRYIIINLIPAMLGTILAIYYSPYGLFAFLLWPLAIGLGIIQYRDAGFNIQNNKLLLSSRTLGKVTTIVPRQRIQSLAVSNSYFQLKRKLTTLRVAIASGEIAASKKLVGMDKEECARISKWYSEFSYSP